MSYLRFFPIFIIALLPCTVLCQDEEETPSIPSFSFLDFDGDGRADVGGYLIQTDGSRNELRYQLVSENQSFVPFEFGKRNHIPVPADYDNDGVTDFVVAQPGEEGSDIIWETRIEGDNNTFVTLGTFGDYILHGCDFNADGIVDKAIYRSGEGIIYLDTEEVEMSLSITLSDEDIPTHLVCGDIDGDGEWEVAFLTQTTSGYRLALYSLSGEELYSDTSIKKLPTDFFLYDSNGDGALDFGVFSKVKRRAFLYTFLHTENFSFTRSRIKVRGGKKVNTAQALYADDTWSLLGYGKRNRFYTIPDSPGRVVRSNLPAAELDQVLSPQGITPTGSSPLDDPDGICPSIEELGDGSGGFLWKHSESGGTVFLAPQCDYRAKSVRTMHRGNIISRMENSGLANPDPCGLRVHFRDRSRNPGSFPSGVVLVVTSTRNQTYCYQISGSTGGRVD